jgi:hypothetical protein
MVESIMWSNLDGPQVRYPLESRIMWQTQFAWSHWVLET